jgi:hypothetical protein
LVIRNEAERALQQQLGLGKVTGSARGFGGAQQQRGLVRRPLDALLRLGQPGWIPASQP